MNAGDILRWGFMIMFGSVGIVSFGAMLLAVRRAFVDDDAAYFFWAFIAFLFFIFAGMLFLALVFDPPRAY